MQYSRQEVGAVVRATTRSLDICFQNQRVSILTASRSKLLVVSHRCLCSKIDLGFGEQLAAPLTRLIPNILCETDQLYCNCATKRSLDQVWQFVIPGRVMGEIELGIASLCSDFMFFMLHESRKARPVLWNLHPGYAWIFQEFMLNLC